MENHPYFYTCFVVSETMSSEKSKALVPINKKNDLAVRNQNNKISRFSLVDEDIKLVSKEDVKKYLPDILGRALARVWIDSNFNKLFSQSPQQALERHGVFLPENVIIEFQKPDSDRPRVVVYQQNKGSKFKLRLFYLQLVMMAGR